MIEAKIAPVSIGVMITTLLLVSCSKVEEHDGRETQVVADAILRIDNGLLPAVAEQGKLGQATNILDRMAHYGVPGLAIAVIHDGEVVWERAHGTTEAGGVEPVTPDTMFQVASISKPVTAVASLRLVQDGAITLDEDIGAWLDSWTIPGGALSRKRPVTVRGILSHTSGFHGNDAVTDHEPGAPVPTLIQALSGEPPAKTGPVGFTDSVDTFDYSGSGYAVLQQLLIDVSGKPFAEFMRESVFLPLQMHRSTFDQAQPTANFAKGHYAGGEPIEGGYRVYSGEAAAGLWSTASDLAKFVLSIQKAEVGENRSLLTQETVSKMLHPQLLECFRCWGLGFEILGQGTASWFTHDGINTGYDSTLIAHSSSGDGAILMTNASLSFGLIDEILDSIATEYDWPNYSKKGQTESVPIPANALVSIPGEYELEADFHVSVIADNGRLFFEIPTQGRTELYASSPTSFFITAIDWGPMTFATDDFGQVTDMMIGQSDQQSTHRRLR